MRRLFHSAVIWAAAFAGACGGGSSGPSAPSPDSLVWFVSDRDGQQEIYRMRTDGSQQTRITATAGFRSVGPSLPTSGDRVIFVRIPIAAGEQDVYSMNPNGSNPVNLTMTNGIAEGSATIRRDGTLIAYTRDGNLWTMNPDGSGQTQVITNGASPSFSPDGSRLVFVRGTTLMIADADGTNEDAITTGEDDADVSWRPDGAKLVFARFNGTDDDLWTVDPDGSNAAFLFNSGGDDDDPVYSADGSTIFFEVGSSPEQVGRIASNGTSFVPLTSTPANSGNPATIVGR